MVALGVSLWDADVGASIEAVRWGVAQDLMRLGTSVIIEWDTWGREERYVLREGAPDSWTLPSSCTTSTFQPTSCGGESKRGTWRTRRWNESLSTRSEEHTSELQSLMRISYAVFCLKKKKTKTR